MAKAVQAQPYLVSCVHLHIFKNELGHLMKLSVQVPQQQSEWSLSTFILPKMDGHAQWIRNL
jgi:hypothetical protein